MTMTVHEHLLKQEEHTRKVILAVLNAMGDGNLHEHMVNDRTNHITVNRTALRPEMAPRLMRAIEDGHYVLGTEGFAVDTQVCDDCKTTYFRWNVPNCHCGSIRL